MERGQQRSLHRVSFVLAAPHPRTFPQAGVIGEHQGHHCRSLPASSGRGMQRCARCHCKTVTDTWINEGK